MEHSTTQNSPNTPNAEHYQRYAVIGNPIEQSRSPQIHALFAAATDQKIEYGRILGDLQPGGFVRAAEIFRHSKNAHGLNITAPFKLDAVQWATQQSEAAKLAGAANCLKFENGRILAENFDGTGLVQDIHMNLGFSFAGKRILIFGAGGAVRGILLPFLAQKPAQIVLVNRDTAKLDELITATAATAQKCGVAVQGISYVELAQRFPSSRNQPNSAPAAFDLAINATSSSLKNELPPLIDTTVGMFSAQTFAYDLSYGKGITPFLHTAALAGATRLSDGLGMLVEQAAEAFLWWRGVRPPTAAVIQSLRS